MSNYTDGKKALADGDYAVAEKKLLKALDRRPDDGELWWAYMLAKCEVKNDGELFDALRTEFSRAAEEGEDAPSVPFYTTAGENALRFDRTGKRREKVEAFCTELSSLWEEKRGKPLKLYKYKPERVYSKGERFAIGAYAAMAGMGGCGGLAVYGGFSAVTWAMWTGLALFLALAVVAAALTVSAKKRGGRVVGGLLTPVLLTIALGIAMLSSGLYNGNTYVVIVSAAALIMVTLLGVIYYWSKLYGNSRQKKAAASAASSRDPLVLANEDAPRKIRNRKPKNEYKDDFD